MTDKELLATIAQQFEYLETTAANTYETVICNLLVDHGYLKVEDIIQTACRPYKYSQWVLNDPPKG